MPALARRPLLLGAAMAASRARAAGQDRILVAGPSDGPLDRFAALLGRALARSPLGRPPLQRTAVGGVDGVTGANQFNAFAEPDGQTALLVPGLALVAWLAGETRVQFNPAGWVPLWAATCTAALVSRVALTPGRRLRIGAASPVGAELPALLALDLLGIGAVLTPPEQEEARLIRGAGAVAAIAAAERDGFHPVMTFGPGPERDPALALVPSAIEMVGTRAPPALAAALYAAASAVQLAAGLVLPPLTPAGAVAAWRRACDTLSQDPALLHEASSQGLRTTRGGEVARFTADVAGAAPAVLALRDWLASRHGWRPA